MTYSAIDRCTAVVVATDVTALFPGQRRIFASPAYQYLEDILLWQNSNQLSGKHTAHRCPAAKRRRLLQKNRATLPQDASRKHYPPQIPIRALFTRLLSCPEQYNCDGKSMKSMKSKRVYASDKFSLSLLIQMAPFGYCVSHLLWVLRNKIFFLSFSFTRIFFPTIIYSFCLRVSSCQTQNSFIYYISYKIFQLVFHFLFLHIHSYIHFRLRTPNLIHYIYIHTHI